ncbi:hypothetical protein N7475_003693 [Penicillium sp. IBT 31633x]|nr:hypothetical protein N7475_003693 [Penicillium sp. IBT 31633x]
MHRGHETLGYAVQYVKLLLRAFLAECLAHFAGILCAVREQCYGNPRHARPDLPQSVRGCIVQPPVVKV